MRNKRWLRCDHEPLAALKSLQDRGFRIEVVELPPQRLPRTLAGYSSFASRPQVETHGLLLVVDYMYVRTVHRESIRPIDAAFLLRSA